MNWKNMLLIGAGIYLLSRKAKANMSSDLPDASSPGAFVSGGPSVLTTLTAQERRDAWIAGNSGAIIGSILNATPAEKATFTARQWMEYNQALADVAGGFVPAPPQSYPSGMSLGEARRRGLA